jgi:triphosphoribosyl-dephospho-CoA synthase
MTRTDATVAPPRVITASDITTVVQLACLLEVSAAKPGNVSPGRHFVDLRYEDFLASAVAIGEPLGGAGSRPLGATIRLAIEATARWAQSNTNLGIVLLLAPLAKAALEINGVGGHLTRTLRDAVSKVLDDTDVQDARDVYAAIRLASPGGLGHAEAQDVAAEPTVSLLETMRLAAHRDGIAREYATAFETTFGTAAPALERARRDGLPWDDAVVETFLTVLAHAPDTHIARRGGEEAATAVSERARHALRAGGVRSAQGRIAIDEMDRSLREPRSPQALAGQAPPRRANIGNPGTTADLTAAAIFVELLREGLRGPGAGGDHARSR